MPSIIRPCSSPKECVPGKTYYKECTKTSNGYCANCSQGVFDFQLSRYYVTGCGINGVPGDYVLRSRTRMDVTCPVPGTYRKFGDWFTNNLCVPCNPRCIPGETWEATSCDGNANRRCESCAKDECPAGMFESRNCSEFFQRACDFCSFPQGCPAGTYMASDCTPKTNRRCVPCRQQCPAGQFMTRLCNATHDAECKPCSTEEKLNCTSPGTYLTTCSGMADSTCGKCDPPCESEKTYEVRACGNGYNRMCVACTQCLGNTYKAAKCTPTSDTKCITCDGGACRSNEYESSSCKQRDALTGLMLHECTPCSFPSGCDPLSDINPTYEAVPCSGSSNATEGTDRVCLPCTVCPEGKVSFSAITHCFS